MDNWSALFDGQTRYFLDIFDSSVKPDVLRFYGREALSEPFNWDIEFTTLQANIPPEEVRMKYASFRMRSGKSVHGMVTRLELLSTSKGPVSLPAYAQFAPGVPGRPCENSIPKRSLRG